MSPLDFELLIRDYLLDYGKDLKGFKVKHNHIAKTLDGNFQIDLKVVFKAVNCDFTILVECKNHKDAIKRDIALALDAKIQSIRAQKGMIFSTADFQSGTIKYARKHKITLVKVVKRRGKALGKSLSKLEAYDFIFYPCLFMETVLHYKEILQLVKSLI